MEPFRVLTACHTAELRIYLALASETSLKLFRQCQATLRIIVC